MLLARPAGVTYPRSSVYVSNALDSKIYDCPWHRLVLDVDIPEGANLAVRTFTAPTSLDATRIAALPDDRWSAELIIGPQDWPEVLIQNGRGRYLWVKVEMNSNGRVTPVIRSMTLYAPRASSLSYLPPVFQEDAVSADFLRAIPRSLSELLRHDFRRDREPDRALYRLFGPRRRSCR